MYRYLPVKEHLYTDETGEYVSFGIRVMRDTDGEHAEIMYVSDISTDFHSVMQLSNLCTAHQLDPLHLPDIIEDGL